MARLALPRPMRSRLFILALLVACALASPAAAQGAPSLSVDDPAAAVEGDTGSTGTASFKVTLSEPPGDPLSPVTVNYTTVDNSAKQPDDYAQQFGTLTFGLLETEKTVEVPAQDDTLDEDNETFKLELSNPSVPATITDDEGVGTITDDDDPPSLTISDPSGPEGNSGTTNAAFEVGLSAPSGRTVTVPYATADGTATQANNDYTPATGTLTFMPGEVTKPVSVSVKGDTAVEFDENFTLVPGAVENVQPGDPGTATITNDDFPPFFNFPPIARLNVTPQLAYVGQVVEFNGSRSRDPDRRPFPLHYRWDLDGNGSFETPTGFESAIGIAFFGAGTQFVGLRVSDGARFDDAVGSVQIFPAPPGVAPDTTPPFTKLVSVRRSLGRALRRGLRVRLGCSEACFIKATAGVDRRTGRSVGLNGRRRTIGRASSAMPKAGSKVLTFKLSRQARRKLAEVKKVRVNLRFKVRDAASNARTVNHKITLRR